LTEKQLKSTEETDDQLKGAQLDHTLYEDAPARVEIELEYIGSDSPADKDENKTGRAYLEQVEAEIREVEDADPPVLSCDCGETFMSWEAAIEHIQKFRD
jgi:hypothetical protein